MTPLESSLFEETEARRLLFEHFDVENLESLGLEGKIAETQVAGAMLAYLVDQKKSELSHITHLEFLDLGDYMTLDSATQRHLELVRPLNADDASSTLCSVLDHTVTAMGGRLLKEWLTHPLVKVERIEARSSAVAELVKNPIVLDELKKDLQAILDMERLMGRVGTGRANARDLAGLGHSLERSISVSATLASLESQTFKRLYQVLELAQGRGKEILNYLNDELPLTVREGGMIRPGASAELDEMNAEIKDKRQWISSLETREKERLGITTLKVGYNKVFGYYIEVTRAQTSKVPPEYIRKQTTVKFRTLYSLRDEKCESIFECGSANPCRRI